MSKPTYEEVVQTLNQAGVPFNSNTVQDMCACDKMQKMCSCGKPIYQGARIGKYAIESFDSDCGCGKGKAPLPDQ